MTWKRSQQLLKHVKIVPIAKHTRVAASALDLPELDSQSMGSREV